MKKIISIILISALVVINALPAFARTYKQAPVHRSSADVSTEAEQYALAAEEWLKSKGSWITSDDIYFIRYSGNLIEHAKEVNVDERTITTDRGTVYNLNYDGFLRSFSGTQFFQRNNNAGENESPWTLIKWPQIVITKDKEEASDSNGSYFYYKYKYEFNEDF